jgi:integral membrane sensor domain MASE1
VWPPTGIALAALTALGLRFWPSVAVGALLANLATPVSPLTAGLIAAGNTTLEALIGATLPPAGERRRPATRCPPAPCARWC